METDVISIPFYTPSSFPTCGNYLLGEVYLCPAVIEKNAHEEGIAFWEEFFYIVIHGILHLLGYDDVDENERREMFLLQDRLWQEYKVILEKWVKN